MGVKQKPWITAEGRSRRWRGALLHFSLISPRNPQRALRNLRALRDEFGESDFCAAYEGKFLLQAGNPEAAREAYADAFRAMRERSDVVGKFIRYVAEGWLALSIQIQRWQKDALHERAKSRSVLCGSKQILVPPSTSPTNSIRNSKSGCVENILTSERTGHWRQRYASFAAQWNSDRLQRRECGCGGTLLG